MEYLIREERAGDSGLVSTVIEDAFGQADEATLVRTLRSDGDIVCALLAEVAGEVTGFIAFEELAVEPDPGYQVWALAPVAVLSARQNKGIGAALVRAGIARAGDAGAGFIAVLGEPRYYERFGFRAESAAGLDVPWAGPHFMGLCLGGASPPVGTARYPRAFG